MRAAAAVAPPGSLKPFPGADPAHRLLLLQTLGLYWRRRRYLDFYLFLIGFLLAIVYHVLHMHPEVRQLWPPYEPVAGRLSF